MGDTYTCFQFSLPHVTLLMKRILSFMAWHVSFSNWIIFKKLVIVARVRVRINLNFYINKGALLFKITLINILNYCQIIFNTSLARWVLPKTLFNLPPMCWPSFTLRNSLSNPSHMSKQQFCATSISNHVHNNNISRKSTLKREIEVKIVLTIS